jgi:hypothetical protein
VRPLSARPLKATTTVPSVPNAWSNTSLWPVVAAPSPPLSLPPSTPWDKGEYECNLSHLLRSNTLSASLRVWVSYPKGSIETFPSSPLRNPHIFLVTRSRLKWHCQTVDLIFLRISASNNKCCLPSTHRMSNVALLFPNNRLHYHPRSQTSRSCCFCPSPSPWNMPCLFFPILTPPQGSCGPRPVRVVRDLGIHHTPYHPAALTDATQRLHRVVARAHGIKCCPLDAC